MDWNSIGVSILKWRMRYLGDKRLIIILSIFVGIISGFAVVLIKSAVYGVRDQLDSLEISWMEGFYYVLLPVVGIVITAILVHFFAKGSLNKGIPYLLYSIGRNSSKIPAVHRWLNGVASAVTVGFGGSVGLEAPVIVTGSAWGSYFGKLFRLNPRYTTVLVGCGAASALAAVFNSPVAGVIFVLEVLVTNANVTFLISLLISSLMGTLVSTMLLEEAALFEFTNLQPVQNTEYIFFLLLGVATGYFSVFFHRTIQWVQYAMIRFRMERNRFLVASLGLGVLIFLVPTLFGEGYWTLRLIIEGNFEEILDGSLLSAYADSKWILFGFLGLSMLLKGVASGLTRAAGGVGGVFAPSMFVGGIMGFLLAAILNTLWPDLALSEANFTLVGMAGVASGILHSPLTIIFLIAEITQGYELLIPLMLVSTIAYSINTWVEKHSWYTKELARRGDYIVHDRDKTILSDLKVHSLIERNFVTVNVEGTLGDLVQAISRSDRNLFPVVNNENELQGIILLNDVRQLIFKPELYDEKTIDELMHAPPAVVNISDSMEDVMEKFDRTEAWNLPVLQRGRYVGFLSRSKIFSYYRRQLQIRAQEIG